MFPKINSTNRRRPRAIFEVDLFRFERNSGVFMRGIRAPRQNLSEKNVERVVLNALGIRLGFAIPYRLRSRNGCEATAGLSSRSTLPRVGSRS
jgi:hypothetical protein